MAGLVWTSVTYPTAIDTYYNPAARNLGAGTGYMLDLTDDCVANHVNTLAESILAIENKLGETAGDATGFASIAFTGIAASAANTTLWIDNSVSPNLLRYTDNVGTDFDLLAHGDLSGLANDDHTQYALLAGRAGGQILMGGTASGEVLTLQSTSHVTRGNVIVNDMFQASSGFRLFLNETLTDLAYDGMIRSVTVDDASTVAGSALFLASDGNYDRADATDMTLMPCTALALEAGSGTKTIMLNGLYRNTAVFSFTQGSPLYVSLTTGGFTHTLPSVAGEIVQPVGYAVTTDTIYFNPMLYWHEVA